MTAMTAIACDNESVVGPGNAVDAGAREDRAVDASAVDVSAVDVGAVDVGVADVSAVDVGAADASATPTYTRDVRPILTRSCVPCHAAGEIAPFALDTFAATAPLVASMLRAVHARTMPPAPIDSSGVCHTFRDTPRLTDAEIATFDAWAAAGAPEGDRSIAAPAAPVLPTLMGMVRTITTASDYAPPTDRPDSYRCFVAEAPVASGSYFITGFDARPGNRRIVHHLIVHYPRTAEAAAQVRALDAAEAGPGYSCFADARVGATPVAAWAPGYGATRFPSGLGVQLEGGRPMVIEIHYNTLAGGGTDRTAVDLEVRTEGVTPGRFVAIVDDDLHLPPRMPEVSQSVTLHASEVTETDTPVNLYGVFPHMHTLATGQHLEVTHAGGAHECVADVPRWNFHWQRLYLYDAPVRVLPSDDLTITCRYDTTSQTAPVVWGEGTGDEMCVAALFISP